MTGMREGLHEFVLRVKGLLRRKRMDREMTDELAFHQEMLVFAPTPSARVSSAIAVSPCDFAGNRAANRTSRAKFSIRRICHSSRSHSCTVLALAVKASGASLLPALRAARIDPMAAIRCE